MNPAKRERRVARPSQAFEVPSHEEIAETAYDRFVRRGGSHGHALEDWLEAERELLQARASVESASATDRREPRTARRSLPSRPAAHAQELPN